MEPVSIPGQVITFYSYKGGTGRTMAIANLACLLAQSYSKRVLVIDWDLEAPGLHRYFPNQLAKRGPAKNKERPEEGGPGLIEMMMELRKLVVADLRVPGYSNPATENQTESSAAACVAKIDFPRFFNSTEIKGLFIMRAGAFDDSYSRNINTFPWEELYRCSPWLFTALANKLSELFDYVLIDSRTGLTDTSGICTMILPQTLVTVFTPNRQSFLGALQIAEKAATYRRKSSDERPLLIMPLVSRVEAAKPELRDKWRFGDGNEWVGFQPGFENLFKKIYDLDDLTLKVYFDRIQLKHVPDYAYGEPIAVLIEKSDDLHSLRGVYSEFCTRLVEGVAPWDMADEAAVLNVQRDVAEKRAEAAELAIKKTRKNFWRAIAVGLTAVVIIFVLGAVNYLQNAKKDRILNQEVSAIGSLRMINAAQLGHRSLYDTGGVTLPGPVGYACNLRGLPIVPSITYDLNGKQILSGGRPMDEQLASGTKNGYQFQLTCKKEKVSEVKPKAEPPKPSINVPASRLRPSTRQVVAPSPPEKVEVEQVVGYTVTATPVDKSSSARHFCTSEDGIIRQLQGTEPCAQGKPL